MKISSFIKRFYIIIFLFIHCRNYKEKVDYKINYKIDTVTFASKGKSYSDYPFIQYRVCDPVLMNNEEVFIIRNLQTSSIDIYGIKEKSFLFSVPVYYDGPNRVYAGDISFSSQIIDTNQFLIIDPYSLRSSIIDKKGNIIKYTKFSNPLSKRAHVVYNDGSNTLITDKAFYISLTSKSYFDNPKDPNIDSLRSLFKYDFNENNSKLLIPKKNVYTSQTGLFNTYPTCLACFPVSDGKSLFISDCQNPYVYQYDLNSELLKDSFKITSKFFNKIKPIDKSIKYSDLTLNDTKFNKELNQYAKMSPEFASLFYNKSYNLLIRQTRLGLNNSEMSIDPYHFPFTFILYDLTNKIIIEEIKIERNEFKQVNFLNGILTSEGILFEYLNIQPHEDSLHFLRIKFDIISTK